MDRYVNDSISLLDQVKIQAQVLVPVLRALRTELGTARANQLITTALRDWSHALFQAVAADKPGTPQDKWTALTLDNMPRIGDAVQYTTLKQEPEAFEFDVTSCRYADFFRALGEPELGGVLLCEADFHIADVAEGTVELTRRQTIMQGATHCDFRYRMKSQAPSSPADAAKK